MKKYPRIILYITELSKTPPRQVINCYLTNINIFQPVIIYHVVVRVELYCWWSRGQIEALKYY